MSFWAESSLHNAISGEASKITGFINGSSYVEDTIASDIVETIVLLIERRRYEIFNVSFGGHVCIDSYVDVRTHSVRTCVCMCTCVIHMTQIKGTARTLKRIKCERRPCIPF